VPASGEVRRDVLWGWHHLAPTWARRLVADAGVHPGDLVVDVGAGTGALTHELVAAGARVIAIELHPQRAAALRERFSDAGAAVTVVRADAADLRLPRRPYRVVANPPFAVTTQLLRRLLAPGTRLVRADLVLPYPLARRWLSGRGTGAGRWARDYTVDLGRRVPTRAFTPPARSDCRTLVISRR
jgi:23S rRNA (adenine-N6)-dimethyltransferase